MVQLYMQDELPGFDKVILEATRKEAGEEATRNHLQRQLAHWRRYAAFSKDPEFIRRAQAAQVELKQMMGVSKNRT